MNKKLMVLMLSGICLCACSLYKIDSDETANDFFPSKASAKDVVYQDNITQPHEIIGTVTVNTERRAERPEVIEKVRREAAILGGDAVTNIQEKPPARKGLLKNAYIRTNYTADVVKFK